MGDGEMAQCSQSTYCSCIGPGLDSQHPYEDSTVTRL